MGIFSGLFGKKATGESLQKSSTVSTTAAKPFGIPSPTIGFMNTCGDAGSEAMKNDLDTIGPLFAAVRTSTDTIPKCQVLFLYAKLDQAGYIIGRGENLRDLIKSAGAYIAVVASENLPDHCVKGIQTKNDWPANITVTRDRKGDKLTNFFVKLFQRMFSGQSMLMAWVELAPQIPGHEDPDVPGTLMIAEAGHLTFSNGSA